MKRMEWLTSWVLILRHYAISSASKAGGYLANEISCDVADDLDCVSKEEFNEPWDMQWHSPIHLPWRKPHSGDEVPDDDESGDDAADMEYDANTVNDAAVLGLVGYLILPMIFLKEASEKYSG